MPRNLARATYQAAVTSHKRDPLLVSMANQDTILVQCYPVMKDELTKIRLHIVAPMQLDQSGKAALALPTFDERNFAFTVPHKVELTSTKELAMSGVDLQAGVANALAGGQKGFSLTGNVDNSLLSRFAAIATTKRDATCNLVFGETHKFPPIALIAPMRYLRPEGLTVVIDQSATMSGYKNELVQGLRQLPNDIPVTLITVLDGEHYLCKTAKPSSKAFKDAVAQLEKTECEGGQSNSLGLYQAMMGSDIAEIAGKSSVLWIHAAQPVATFQSDYLSQVLKRIRSVPALFDLQVASGPNEVLKESYDYPALVRVTRTGSLSHDMKRLFDSWVPRDITEISFAPPSSIAPVLFSQVTQNGSGNVTPSGSATVAQPQKSGQVRGKEVDLTNNSVREMSQLIAYQNAMDLYHKGNRMAAYRIADQNHIVTPVSSAVVTDDMPVPEEKERAAKAEEEQARAKMFPFMAATKLAEKPALPILGQAAKNPIDSAFEHVTNQLNSLSSAAGSASGGSYSGASAGAPGYPQEATDLMKQKSADYEAKMEAKPQRFSGARDAEVVVDAAAKADGEVLSDRRFDGNSKSNIYPSAAPPVMPGAPASSASDAPYGKVAGAGGSVGGGIDSFPSQGSQRQREEYRAKDEVGNNEMVAGDKYAEMDQKKSLNMGQAYNNAPVLQGATNGLVSHSKEMQYGAPSGMDQSVVSGVNTAGTVKTDKSAVDEIKAKLLPEPDTTPMVLIVLIVGLTGIFLTTRRSARAEPSGNK